MFILRSGITGFQPAPSVDKKQFKQICYSIFGKEATDLFHEDTGKNFSECIVTWNGSIVHVLLNSHYPFVAFTSQREISEQYLPFIDESKLSERFNQYYKVLSSDQLNEPLVYNRKGKKIIVKNENTLHQVELEQLAYWQPATVGEVVFNYWD